MNMVHYSLLYKKKHARPFSQIIIVIVIVIVTVIVIVIVNVIDLECPSSI
jgi:hypothetical protein